MVSSTYGFLINEDLPSEDAIVARCRQVGFRVTGAELSAESSQSVIAWVKYGLHVTIDEARTQDWTAKALHEIPDCRLVVPRVFDAFTRESSSGAIGYIAMQFIDAANCSEGDVIDVAMAVQTLISLRAPDATLGHIGGGSIVHSFFPDWIPVADYRSVQDLDDHINNILRYMGNPRRVDIVTDAKSGFYLCPCDIHPGNFKKLQDGRVAAFDFRATCFVPRILVEVAMNMLQEPFARSVADRLKSPVSADVSALVSASHRLVQFGRNPVAFPQGLKRKPL